MGTTVTAAHVGEHVVTIAHVGDSRCYVVRDGKLKRITTDHSLVAELVARGKLTEEQAETHPQRSVITRALGPEPNVQVDIIEEPAHAGDLFMRLLGRPDVNGARARPRAAARRTTTARWPTSAAALIAAANANGGRDNITVVLFRLEEIDAPVGVPAGHAHRGVRDPQRRRDERVRDVHRRSGRRAAPGRQPAHGPHARDGRRPRPGQRRRGGRVPGLRHRRALRGASARPADRRRRGTQPRAAEPATRAPQRRPPALLAREADRVRKPGRPARRLLARDATGVLRRRRRIPWQRRDALPRAAVRTPARHRALLSRFATPA